MQPGYSCRKGNKRGEPKGEPFHKRQDEKGTPFFFYGTGHIRRIFAGKSNGWGSPAEERKNLPDCKPEMLYLVDNRFLHCYTSPIEAGWREIV